MFLFFPVWSGAMFKLIQSAFEQCGDAPWTGERVGQFIDMAVRSIRSSGPAGKHNVAY